MFSVAAESYDRFMGRYSSLLAHSFADFAGVRPGQRVLEVGCGPGALTSQLIERVGAGNVQAVDPSRPFVEAIGRRFPDLSVSVGRAEDLSFGDQSFDIALAQLVVHFMDDPVQGLAEMGRVVNPGGVVAACVWDNGGRRGPLELFWTAAREVDADLDDGTGRPGISEGDLVELFRTAGLSRVVDDELHVDVIHDTFDDWWQPFLLGVGPAGVYFSNLPAGQQRDLEIRCRSHFGPGPFPISAVAWTVRATV